jgi:hypothetical protein
LATLPFLPSLNLEIQVTIKQYFRNIIIGQR